MNLIFDKEPPVLWQLYVLGLLCFSRCWPLYAIIILYWEISWFDDHVTDLCAWALCATFWGIFCLVMGFITMVCIAPCMEIRCGVSVDCGMLMGLFWILVFGVGTVFWTVTGTYLLTIYSYTIDNDVFTWNNMIVLVMNYLWSIPILWFILLAFIS